MNQESISGRYQVGVGVNCKNKILQNVLEPIESDEQFLQVSLIPES